MSDPSHGMQQAASFGIGALIATLLATVFGFVRGVFRGKLRESDKAAAETERTEITAKLRTHRIDVEAAERDADRRDERIEKLEAALDAYRAESVERERERANSETEWVRQIARLEGKVEGLERKVKDLETELRETQQERASCEERARRLLEENDRLRREGAAA